MKLKIHMKSGKTLVQRGVKEYNFTCIGGKITGVKLKLKWWASFTIVLGTLAPDQIEAVTRH